MLFINLENGRLFVSKNVFLISIELTTYNKIPFIYILSKEKNKYGKKIKSRRKSKVLSAFKIHINKMS